MMFRLKKQPIIHVQHVNNPDDTFFLPDTYGVEIHQRLTPAKGEYHIIKHMPSCFLGTNLEEILRENEITDVVICGMMSHMCIDTTTRACQDFDLNVVLLDDACTTKDLEYHNEIVPAEMVHKVFMAALSGVFADVIKTSDFNFKFNIT